MIGPEETFSKLFGTMDFIESEYLSQTTDWTEYCELHSIEKYNLKKKQVIDIINDRNLMNYIQKYREFIDLRSFDVYKGNNCFQDFNFYYRLKTDNSMNEKIQDYIHYRKEHGRIMIHKCFNDILGTRIIIDSELNGTQLMENISKRYGKYVCVDSSKPKGSLKKDYSAIHVYLKTESNTDFRWEIQIWKKEDEYSNNESHRTHRFRYTAWERD